MRAKRRTRLWALVAAASLLAVTAAAFPLWKPLARQSRWYVIASNIGNDSMRRLGLRSAQIGQETFAPPPDSDIAPQVARMRHVYDQYLRYSGTSRRDVAGKRILELGPGITMSIPLLFVADGASFAAGVDRFVPFQRGPYYDKFYGALRDTLEDTSKPRYDRALRREPLSLNTEMVTLVGNRDLTDVVGDLGPQSYDMVVSNAVMEEIYDPTPVLMAQDQLLRPGGAMVHLIDLRDYGMFSSRGFHPLEFLTIPDWIYRYMVERSGQPDRRLLSYYRDAAKRMGYDSRIYITRVLGHPDPLPEPKERLEKGVDYTDADLRMVQDIRPRLQSQFRAMPDEELLAQSILFVARKPAVPGSEADRRARR